MTPVFFETPNAFRKWLKKNHAKEKELIVGFYKAGTGRKSITWSESVDQALCFGWIDGVRRSIDELSYCNRFTPRKANSNWSAINIKKVEELSKKGLMEPAGLAAFENRTGARSNVYSYENEPGEFPKHIEKEFRKKKKAWDFFSAQAPSYKRVSVHWVITAKQEETMKRRLAKLIEASAEGRRL